MNRFTEKEGFYRHGHPVPQHDPCASHIPQYTSFEVISKKKARAEDQRTRNINSTRVYSSLMNEPYVEGAGNYTQSNAHN